MYLGLRLVGLCEALRDSAIHPAAELVALSSCVYPPRPTVMALVSPCCASPSLAGLGKEDRRGRVRRTCMCPARSRW